MSNWKDIMEQEGAFEFNEGDRLMAGIDSETMADLNEHDVLRHIEKQKARGVPRENLRLLCGEKMIPEPDQRFNEETGEWEFRSLIDADKGIKDAWHEFEDLSDETIFKTFWRIM